MVLRETTRKAALLDLLLVNREGVTSEVVIVDALGQSERNKN